MAPPDPAGARSRFLRELDTLVRARYPLLYLVSPEEQRVDGFLAELAERHGKELYEWSVIRGLRRVRAGRASGPVADSEGPLEGLLAAGKLTAPSLVVFKDFHRYLEDPRVVRAARELAHALKSSYTTAVILSPSLVVPAELEKDLTVLDVPLPSFHDLAELLREILGVVTRSKRATVHLTQEHAEQLVKAAQGLTLAEAENAFAKAIADNQRLDADDIKLVMDEKRQVVRKSGLLEFYPVDESLADVGGLDALKRWLQRREGAFGEAARNFRLPAPRGLLLLGVQGCGKSLSAKAIASTWKLPLLRLDMGRIFSGLVGSSEENLRRAIHTAESLAPVVLWIDEIEKGLSGVGSGSNDSGVSARVFGTLLTWLQEKTAPVFVVATANRIDGMPPELLRKGRFDEIFFIDLPEQQERKDILGIHLARRKRAPAGFDLDALAAHAEAFSGAELEQAVVSALYDAFADGTDLTQGHLIAALRETFPLATTMREEIERLREWARFRTRPASGPRPDMVAA